MSAHNILKVDAPVQKFVYLDVGIVIGLPRLFAIILFRKKPRGPQDNTGERRISMAQFSQILRRGLGYAIDVSGNRSDVLGYPSRGTLRGRSKRPTKGARRTGADE